uniref:Uncharacterized protein n=1 Tax=Setaria italica TaxID=4555 RepID=K4A3U9_SETIT
MNSIKCMQTQYSYTFLKLFLKTNQVILFSKVHLNYLKRY